MEFVRRLPSAASLPQATADRLVATAAGRYRLSLTSTVLLAVIEAFVFPALFLMTLADSHSVGGDNGGAAEVSLILSVISIILAMQVFLVVSLIYTLLRVNKFGLDAAGRDVGNLNIALQATSGVLFVSFAILSVYCWQLSSTEVKLYQMSILSISFAVIGGDVYYWQRVAHNRSLYIDLRDHAAQREREAQLAKLEETTYSDVLARRNEIPDTCTICLESYEAQDSVIVLQCGHIYHGRCIRAWLQDSAHKQCPHRCEQDPLAPMRAPALRPESDARGEASEVRGLDFSNDMV